MASPSRDHAPGPGIPVSPFGQRLRQWRAARNLSQLELATRAGSTSRHVSFLETGRSRPTRAMVLRLADTLEVGLRDRNQLLQVAGFAPAYPHSPTAAPELAPFRRIIDQLLAAHEPFPALVLDPHAQVIATNRACPLLFGPDLIGTNLIERYATDAAARDAILNWPEVAWAGLARLRKQLRQTPLDQRLTELVDLAETAIAGLPRPEDSEQHSLVACPWFRVEDTVIRTIVLAARFDTAVEVTLDELRIELIYPQDATAERFFRDHAS
jgi:transcriptional regulator with XRE-family HTH domain